MKNTNTTPAVKLASVESMESPQEGHSSTFEEPKLTFVEPELVKKGDLSGLTAGFLTTFSP